MKLLLPKILFILFFPILLHAQTDTAVLSVDQLLLQDIQPSKAIETNQEVFAATRSLKKLKELPFTIYVITKEEIRNNGYRTLVDALKMQPGIRISQPGSALEGELFMMRGLVGNTYTKILLNGHPIKPSVVKGMPIGAQIPIQQAERIEIIYGAMGTLYGSDASAGIINIVLEETKRPVYTQANLSVGSKQYTNLDISFGGRLGKRKNTLQYGLFGSYTFRSDLKIQHAHDSLFNVEKYFTGIVDINDIENYVTDQDGNPIINDLPHQSRMVGFNLGYRAMKFSAQMMYRRDHSSIGLNPASISYTNPLNYIGERIINANFSLQKDYRRFGFEFGLSYLQYRMDNRSSYNYVYNSTSALLDLVTFADNIDFNTGNINYTRYDSLSKSHFNKYFDGTRFSFSESYDIRNDIIFNYFPTKNIDLKIGLTSTVYASVPIVRYSKVPLESALLKNNDAPTNDDLTPFERQKTNGYRISGFAQLYWSLEKWTMTGGIQWYQNKEFLNYTFLEKFISGIKKSLDSRIGINYQFNSKWSARAYYGTAIRIPSAFYKVNTYNISLQNDSPFQLSPNDLNPETTTTYEVGLRWIPSSNKNLDVVGFHTQTSNLINYEIKGEVDAITGAPISYSHGFYNSDSSSKILYGLQTNFLSRSKLFDFGFNLTLSYGSKKEDKKLYPTMIRKTRIVFRPTQRISFTFDTVFNSRFWNDTKFNQLEIKKFRTFDFLMSYNVNRNFRMFFKLRNAFNKQYAGINASGTADDLIYNPQEKRTFRLGMSYRI